MSVKIQVTDRRNDAVQNASVYVKWSTGQSSSAKTDSSGVADLNCTGGTIDYVEVWGDTVLRNLRVDDYAIVSVRYNR